MDAHMPPETNIEVVQYETTVPNTTKPNDHSKHHHMHGIETAASHALDLLRDTTLERESTPGRGRKEPKASNNASFFEQINELTSFMAQMKNDHIRVLEQIQKFNSKAKKDLELSNEITNVKQNIQLLKENIQKLEQLVTKIESTNPMLTLIKHGPELSKMTTADGKAILDKDLTLDNLLKKQHEIVLSTQNDINEVTTKLKAFVAQHTPTGQIKNITEELTGIKGYISLLESNIKKYFTATIGTAFLIGFLIWQHTHKA